MRRIAAAGCKAYSLPIGLELLFFAIAGLKDRDGNGRDLPQRNLVQGRLDLEPFRTVKVIDVLDLVSQYIGQLIIRLHPLDEAGADEDVPSRQCEGIDEIAVGDVVKAIGKFPL